MQKQMSLFATFSYASFTPEEKEVLLTNPQAGALMAIYALDDLFTHISLYLSLGNYILDALVSLYQSPKNT